MFTRRYFMLAAAASAAGCASTPSSPPNYEETFSHLAIAPAGNVMAVVGTQYDYLFTPPPTLVAALRSHLRKQLSGQFRTFLLDTPSHITGRWELIYQESDDGSAGKVEAQALGFVERKPGFHVLNGTIEGTRFKKNSAPAVAGSETTNRPYRVKVQSMYSSKDGSLESSPIRTRTQGGEVLIIVGAVVLLSLLSLLTGKSPCITCK